ncbi:CyP450 monooxygenase [Neolentinus lepideus HHB14362 ss-1]|uniref:CyP450 monooxygenase n=1 Tax=Neolentinus lepideus HHB14362 ss-1 TaxID=1314782 RepID=A0A165PQB4_9AGAM|nr:CyP450 monooxygenase [Neolentinus lepideus HHB14362 ss-1]
MSLLLSILLCAVAGIALVLTKAYLQRKRVQSVLSFPPGPKPLPVLGNMLDVPKKTAWKTYAAWSKQFGDIIHLNILGEHIVIINSVKIANDLFEKRVNIYSDRPIVPMLELTGWHLGFSLMPYNEFWKKQKRMFHQMLGREHVSRYNNSMVRKAHALVQRVLDNPGDFYDHAFHWSTDSTMATVYNYEVASKDDRYVFIAEHALGFLAKCLLPGAFLVNYLPFLQHLPDWLPGMAFKRLATTCHKYTVEMRDVPYDLTKKQMTEGIPEACVTSDLIDKAVLKGELNYEEEELIKGVSWTAYAAGYDTTASSVLSGILGLLLFPEAQRKAQAEIDSVVGSDRLPDFRDRDALPYTAALLREVLRWGPVVPMALPRRAAEDDVYNGYYIPKGATVFGNSWGMLHNEDTFEDPERFMPERWLKSDGTLKEDFPIQAFGFGRRLCSGRHMATENVWMALVMILSVFNVSKAKNEAGDEIPVTAEFSDGWICRPLPFKCAITPRNPDTARLVRDFSP